MSYRVTCGLTGDTAEPRSTTFEAETYEDAVRQAEDFVLKCYEELVHEVGFWCCGRMGMYIGGWDDYWDKLEPDDLTDLMPGDIGVICPLCHKVLSTYGDMWYVLTADDDVPSEQQVRSP